MKRCLDLIVSLLALIVLAVPLIVLMVVIRIKLGSPIFFKQLRPGLNSQLFEMVKFRTMLNLYDLDGKLLPDELRITRFGKFLRSTSLDEVPEFWNVLRGEMSLVGPRPLLVEYLPLYTPEQRRRHEVRPGITGLAQVSGRNALTWEEKFNLDILYVNQHTLWMDFKILIVTIKKVFLRENISAQGTVTAHPFKGNNNVS